MIEFLRMLDISLFGILGFYAKDTNMDSFDRDTSNDHDDAVPDWWEDGIRTDVDIVAFWNENMMGAEGSGNPIIKKDDYRKYDSGDTIKMNVSEKIFGDGVTGENKLEGNEDTYSIGQFSFTVDDFRNGIAYTQKFKREVNYPTQVHFQRLLTDWTAVRNDDLIFNEMINGSTSPRSLYGNDAASVDALNDGDHLGTNEIDKVKLALQRLGAQPFETPYGYCYGLVIDEISEYRLKGDTLWNQANREAGPRSYKENALFKGSMMGKYGKVLGIWNGVVVYVYNSIRSGATLRGTYLRPEAQVVSAHTAGASTLVVGTNNNKNYLKYWPSSGKVYIQAEGSNTAEEVAYSAKANNYTLTLSGTSSYNHGVGAICTYYESVSRCIGFGAESVAYGYGMPITRIDNARDYGYVKGMGIHGVNGAKLIEDSNSAIPNVVILNVKAFNPSNTI
ncbi:MAG: DUF4043 family protein [Candidatus Thorarchaeota archaeon]